MTNKPMLSVEKILIGIDKDETEHPDGWWPNSVGAEFGAKKLQELRALLDKPAYPNRLCHVDYTAHPYICGCLKGDDEAQRRFDEHHSKAAQQQCEPVAYLYGLDRLKNQHVDGCSASLSKNPGKGFVPIFTEQPAPVADHTQCEECKGWGYHENHHEGGGTECGACGGSGNATVAVAVVMPECESFDISDWAGSFCQEALSFGVNEDSFARCIRTTIIRTLAEVVRLNGVKP